MPVRYKAVEVTAPGVVNVVEREQTEPRQSEVRVSVEACGVYYSDAATFATAFPELLFRQSVATKSNSSVRPSTVLKTCAD